MFSSYRKVNNNQKLISTTSKSTSNSQAFGSQQRPSSLRQMYILEGEGAPISKQGKGKG
jgi:hypothetical protein